MCNTRPCLNGGVCVDVTNNNGSLLDGILLVNTNDFRCVCPKGYAGQRCGSKYKHMALTITTISNTYKTVKILIKY